MLRRFCCVVDDNCGAQHTQYIHLAHEFHFILYIGEYQPQNMLQYCDSLSFAQYVLQAQTQR
jgi:hypothetical protein